MLVLDEADEMLNKGFKEQIYDVYRFEILVLISSMGESKIFGCVQVRTLATCVMGECFIQCAMPLRHL